MYKIIKRIQYKQNTIGYQLISNLGRVFNFKKEDVIRLAMENKIYNATYNKSTNSLKGICGYDLRTLDVLVVDSDKLDINRHNKVSRHEMAKKFMSKQKLLGELLDFKLMDNDRVQLVNVKNKEDTGRLVIPSFITDTLMGDSMHRAYVGLYKLGVCALLQRCKYTEIFVDNPPDVLFDASYLCSEMESETIKLTFRHPEYVKSLEGLFNDCENVREIDISGINIKRAISTKQMFRGCDKLEVIRFGSISSMDTFEMFSKCCSIKHLNLSNIDVSNVVDASGMFTVCTSLVSLDTTGWNTGSFKDISNMFIGCSSIKTIDISDWDIRNVTEMQGLFDNCNSLERLIVKGGNSGGKYLDTSNVVSFNEIFNHCESLVSLDTSWIKTSKATSMDHMFNYCASLKNLDLSGFDTSNVIHMGGMFYRCESLEYLNISNFNTRNVTSMAFMFNGCKSLRELDISSFETPHLTSIEFMFSKCEALKRIDISNFNTSLLVKLDSLFNECTSLESVDMHGLDLGNVKSVDSLFYKCTSLKEVDMSGVELYKLEYMRNMFYNCVALEKIKLKGINLQVLSSLGAFYKCSDVIRNYVYSRGA